MREIISIVTMPRNIFAGDMPHTLPQREVVIYTDAAHTHATEDMFAYRADSQGNERVIDTGIDLILARQNPPGITITVFPAKRNDVYLIHRKGINLKEK